MLRRPGAVALCVLGLALGLRPGVAVGPAAAAPLPGMETIQMSTITLTRADDGRTVDLNPGDTLVLRLAENPTTGYQWALDAGSDDVLALQASDYVGPTGPAVGGGGERVFTFKAKQAGTATVRLKLWRAWAGDKSITERFAATVRVRQ